MNYAQMDSPIGRRSGELLPMDYERQLIEKEKRLVQKYDEQQRRVTERVTKPTKGLERKFSFKEKGVVREFFRERRKMEKSGNPTLSIDAHFKMKKAQASQDDSASQSSANSRMLHMRRRSDPQLLPPISHKLNSAAKEKCSFFKTGMTSSSMDSHLLKTSYQKNYNDYNEGEGDFNRNYEYGSALRHQLLLPLPTDKLSRYGSNLSLSPSPISPGDRSPFQSRASSNVSLELLQSYQNGTIENGTQFMQNGERSPHTKLKSPIVQRKTEPNLYFSRVPRKTSEQDLKMTAESDKLTQTELKPKVRHSSFTSEENASNKQYECPIKERGPKMFYQKTLDGGVAWLNKRKSFVSQTNKNSKDSKSNHITNKGVFDAFVAENTSSRNPASLNQIGESHGGKNNGTSPKKDEQIQTQSENVSKQLARGIESEQRQLDLQNANEKEYAQTVNGHNSSNDSEDSEDEKAMKKTPDPGCQFCSICGRQFADDRIERHSNICKLASNKKKRKVFNSRKQRTFT